MSTVEITAGTTEPLEVYARAAAGGALTGSSNLRVQIRRVSDGFFLDFNDSTFKNTGWTTRQATLTEVSSTNAPGEYRYSVDTTGWSAGSYIVTFLEVSTSLVTNGPQFAIGEIRIVTATPSALSARIPAALVSGRMDAFVGAMANNTITAAAIATGAIDADAIADGAIDAGAIASDAITTTKIADGTITAAKLADDAITAAKIAADAIGTSQLAADAVAEIQSGLAAAADVAAVGVAVADVQARLPAALVGGRIDASVGTVASGAITATSIAADAIGSSQLATSAVSEIQTGLATASALSDVALSAGDAATRAADIQSRLPAALVGGRMDASVGAMQADTLTSSALATSAVSEIQSGLATTSAVSAVGTVVASVASAVDAVGLDVDNLQTRIPAALVGGRMDSHVGAMGTDTITSGAVASSAVTELQNGLATTTAVSAVETKVIDVQGRLPAALVSGRIDAYVGAMGANTLTAFALAADAVTEIGAGIGAAVWATAVSSPATGTYGWYVQRVFQLGFNRLELDSVGGGRNVLYDDDESTVIATFTLRDVAGNALNLTTGAPARRAMWEAP